MRFILFLIATLCISQQSMAQTSSTFEVPVFKKIVEVSASNVNLRKRPDVKSARVGVVTNGQVLAVVSETDEWYKIFTSEWIAPYVLDGGNGTIQETRVGYVMKKFCRDAAIKALKKGNEDVYIRQSGRHKGICMYTSYNGHEEDWYGFTFAIGKQIGNIVVLPYRIYADKDEEANRRVELKKTDYKYQMVFKDGIEGWEIAFDKLTDTDIDYIINNVSKMSKNSGRLLFYLDDEHREYDGIIDINYGRGANQLQFQEYPWTSDR